LVPNRHLSGLNHKGHDRAVWLLQSDARSALSKKDIEAYVPSRYIRSESHPGRNFLKETIGVGEGKMHSGLKHRLCFQVSRSVLPR